MDSAIDKNDPIVQLLGPKAPLNAINVQEMMRLKALAEAESKKRIAELNKKAKKRDPKPVHLRIKDISRSGLVTVSFNQLLELPFFARNKTLNPPDNKDRR